MSRLSEKEIDLIRAARVGGVSEQASAAQVLQNAQRLQYETLVGLLSRGAAFVAKWTGLAALAAAIDDGILRTLRSALRRRSAIGELKRLDDHLLHDIGLERSMVESYVDTLSAEEMERARKPRAAHKGLRHWLQRRRAIRELEALDDHQLADIGVLRSMIPATVDEAMERKAREASQVTAAEVQGLTQQALGAVPPLQSRRADRTVATARKQAPILPLWIGPWLEQPQGPHAR